jgi:hypothetical protein
MITQEIILRDVGGFERRIIEAREKLAALPTGGLAWVDHKRRETKRKEYLDEIQHVNRLIQYAKEGLGADQPHHI